MKYLIYELGGGDNFCNQLYSFETAIYLSKIMKRKLILLVNNPISNSWDNGRFLDFFTYSYKKYLPYELEVYYKNIPKKIKNILKNNYNVLRLTNNKSMWTKKDKLKTLELAENLVFVDKEFEDINNFLDGKDKTIIDFKKDFMEKYLYITKPNTLRCFKNFYTTPKNYKLMKRICKSLQKDMDTKYFNEEDINTHNYLFNTKILSEDPKVYTIDEFLTNKECEHLINLASNNLQIAKVNGKNEYIISDKRTNSNC